MLEKKPSYCRSALISENCEGVISGSSVQRSPADILYCFRRLMGHFFVKSHTLALPIRYVFHFTLESIVRVFGVYFHILHLSLPMIQSLP